MNAPTTPSGTRLGLPAYHVELRWRTDEFDNDGQRIEAVNLTHAYVEWKLAYADFRRLLAQMGVHKREGRWHLVLIDNSGTIRREFTR